MAEQMATATMESSERAHIAAQYDQLLEALGEEPFRSASALQRTENADAVLDDAQLAAQRTQLLTLAAQKSLRCAELIEQTLEASTELTHAQIQITSAVKTRKQVDDSSDSDIDDDVDMDANDASSSTSESALLLTNLVATSREMQDASEQYTRLAAADKSRHDDTDMLTGANASGVDGSSSSTATDAFRDLYMDAFTTAFGDDLDAFRQEERFESRDVAYLISCIHANADVFSPLQQTLVVDAASANTAAAVVVADQ